VRHGWIIGALLLAGGCQFNVDGLTSPSNGTTDGGSPIVVGNGPPDLASSPPLDLSGGGAAPDLAEALDLTSAPPDLTPLPTTVGDACSGQCGGGLVCMTWVANGYCSQFCNNGAMSSCPTGSSCVDIGGGNRYCLLNEGGGCMRSDLKCRDCGANVCGPPSFCGGC
jgi:hypothetical protein